MADPDFQPLKFDCYRCGKLSTYPKFLKADETATPGETVIKRCITCGTENKIQIPEGWQAANTGTVLRGLE